MAIFFFFRFDGWGLFFRRGTVEDACPYNERCELMRYRGRIPTARAEPRNDKFGICLCVGRWLAAADGFVLFFEYAPSGMASSRDSRGRLSLQRFHQVVAIGYCFM